MDRDLFQKEHKTHHNFDKPKQQKSQVNGKTEMTQQTQILKAEAKAGRNAR